LRRAAKVDNNQADIIDALRRIGVQVEVIGLPLDLLICHRGETALMECKTAEGRLTKGQAEFLERWPGKVHIVHSPREALEAVLGEAMK